MTLTFGSLFAGIGGFDLGFERAGMECRWQVEIDPYCQKVLAKHWPDVGRWDDVRTFPPTPAEDWEVDVICGGFPCQDISNAGKRAGLEYGHDWFHANLTAGRVLCMLVKCLKGEADIEFWTAASGKQVVTCVESLGDLWLPGDWMRPYWQRLVDQLK